MAKTKHRVLSLVMALVMIFTLLPVTAFAVEGTELKPGEVKATKTLLSEKPDADGNYTLVLTVQGKDKPVQTKSNADVVLVVDNSGSMASSVGTPCRALKETFTKEVKPFYDLYTCKDCGARYSSGWWGLVWDTRPDHCTGEKGKFVRIDTAMAVSKECASSILAGGTDNQMAVIGFAHEMKE